MPETWEKRSNKAPKRINKSYTMSSSCIWAHCLLYRRTRYFWCCVVKQYIYIYIWVTNSVKHSPPLEYWFKHSVPVSIHARSELHCWAVQRNVRHQIEHIYIEWKFFLYNGQLEPVAKIDLYIYIYIYIYDYVIISKIVFMYSLLSDIWQD